MLWSWLFEWVTVDALQLCHYALYASNMDILRNKIILYF